MKASALRIVFAAAMQGIGMVVGIGIAWAEDQVIEKPFRADTPDTFAQIARVVRKEMAPDGRYEFIRPDDKAKAEADMNLIAGMLQKSGSVAAMDKDEKVKLFNAQEHLNGILAHNDRNRLVCENTAPIGSNIRRATCMTVGEIEIKRLHDQKGIQDLEMRANQNNCGLKIKGRCPTDGAGKHGG